MSCEEGDDRSMSAQAIHSNRVECSLNRSCSILPFNGYVRKAIYFRIASAIVEGIDLHDDPGDHVTFPRVPFVCILSIVQGNVIFALPFVPGHQPLHVTDILGLIFVMTGLVVYRFGPQLRRLFVKIEAGGGQVAKAAASMRGHAMGRDNGSGSTYALGEHRKPLLDLAEEGEEDADSNLHNQDRRKGGTDSRRQRKSSKPVDDEWEM